MNLRQFCQTGTYPAALVTTFNFDPLFFERVVLSDLLAGGARRIIVLADAEQAYEAIEQVRGQLVAIGRRYRLIPVSAGGAFHPKVCIRLGPKGAVVACGSHNLSRPGWLGRTPKGTGGGNREVSVAWRVEPDSPAASDLKAAVTALSQQVEIPADRDALMDLLDAGWLAGDNPNPSQDWSWLVTGQQTTLAAVLEDRWRGRRFDRLRVVTGSTDDKAAMIRWASRTFDVREALVEVDIDRCQFRPSLLHDLPLDLRLSPTNGNPRTHLKVFLFEAGEQSAAVVGSANCSSAAWLRKSSEGGNVESVIVYDHCNPRNFTDLFRGGDEAGRSWHTVPLATGEGRADEDSPRAVPNRQLRRMQLQTSQERLLVHLAPDPKPNEHVSAVLGGQRVALHYSASDRLWIGRVAETREQIETPFGWAEIGPSGETTNTVWVDDLDSLSQASDWRMPLRAIRNLSERATSAEYRRLLGDLRLLSDTILKSVEDFPDTLQAGPRQPDNQPETPPEPLKPGALIRSLAELEHRPAILGHGEEAAAGLSLSGVMHLFFSEAHSGSESEGRHDPTTSESQKSQEEIEGESVGQTAKNEPLAEAEGPSEQEKARLVRQLDDFVNGLATAQFANTCSARQLQQAVAYPLAVARFAAEGPWGEEIEQKLAGIIVRTVEVLLKRESRTFAAKGPSELKPLLQEVRDRYCAKGKENDFQRVIGDGLLWLVLGGCLGVIEHDQDDRFELSLLVADVAKTDILTATAVPERLIPLARRLGKAGNPLASIDRIRRIVGAVDQVEDHLAGLFQHYDKSQRTFDDKAGDWLWRPKIGFVQVRNVCEGRRLGEVHARQRAAEIKKVYLDFYLNIRQIRKADHAFGTLLEQLEATAEQPSGDATTGQVGE